MVCAVALLACSEPDDSTDTSAPTTSSVGGVGAIPTTSVGETTSTLTRPTTTTVATTTVPVPTTAPANVPVDPVTEGLGLAQQLATAYADGDWETARQISPLPAWSDATYDEGFAGLDASTLVLADSAIIGDRVVLWLMQVAHETRPNGPQTSTYCVRWEYVTTSGTIDKIAGETLATDPGTIPVSDLQRAAWACARFDEPTATTPVATPPPAAPTPEPVPPSPMSEPPPAFPASEQLPRGWMLLDRLGSTYICKPVGTFGTGNFDCASYFGTVPIFLTPQLRCSSVGVFGNQYDCTSESYYPSEIDGYEESSIDGQRVLCRWDQCWEWNLWESPRSATLGPPDYECISSRCTAA